MIKLKNLKHKLTFRKIVEERNDYGEFEETTESEFTRYAEVLNSESRNSINAEGREVEDYKTWRIRYTSKVTPDMDIAYKGKSYEIEAIENPGERNRELIIEAVSYVQN